MKEKKITKKSPSGSHFWASKAMYVDYVHVLRAHRATEGACSTSGRHLVAQRPIRIALECRIRYFWSIFDQFWIFFCHFVFSSKLSILVELWKVFDPKLMVLHGFCRAKIPRELQKKANVVRNRADTFLKPFVGGF